MLIDINVYTHALSPRWPMRAGPTQIFDSVTAEGEETGGGVLHTPTCVCCGPARARA